MKTQLWAASATAALALSASAVVLAAASVDVVQSNKTFDKTTVTVAAGDTVNFVNNDAVAHNVMASGADAFNLGLMKPGESKGRAFTKPGRHEVKCALHPRMKMTVEVK